MLTWLLRTRRARETGTWDTDGDATLRDLVAVANDGIISSAAIAQGLLVAGATGQEAVIGVLALVIVGTLTTAGTHFGEGQAERRTQLAIIAGEQERLALAPDEEFLELVDHYCRLGLSEELSYRVASELHEKDALRAQLDAEFDLDEPRPITYPYLFAAKAGAAFLAGSVVPFLLLLALPWGLRGEITLLVVVVSLAISGFVGSRAEHSSALSTMVRTVTIGLFVLGVSTLAGSLVSF